MGQISAKTIDDITKNEKKTFVIVGESGAGKTTAIKCLLNQEIELNTSYLSDTSQTAVYSNEKYQLVDTPGSGDTYDRDFEFMYDITTKLNYLVRIDHIFILIPKTNLRITQSTNKILNFIFDFFLHDYCTRNNIQFRREKDEKKEIRC